MSRTLLRAACATVALGIATGCGSDTILQPAAAARRASALIQPELVNNASRDGTDTVVAMLRRAPLDHDMTASGIIGPAGGRITIGEAGATIVFPAGALTDTKQIKMTAKAGWNVAYEFCPHGITFAAPVVIQQNLAYTQARPSDLHTLQAGYYKQGLDAIFVDRGKSRAQVSELRSVRVDQVATPGLASFFIYHFSGYIMSSGFAPGSGGSDSSFAQP